MAPYFSRREVLKFLVNEASGIEAATEDACWHAVWDAFSDGMFDGRDDGPFIEFQKVCDFYGYGPMQNRGHTWTMRNANVERVA